MKIYTRRSRLQSILDAGSTPAVSSLCNFIAYSKAKTSGNSIVSPSKTGFDINKFINFLFSSGDWLKYSCGASLQRFNKSSTSSIKLSLAFKIFSYLTSATSSSCCHSSRFVKYVSLSTIPSHLSVYNCESRLFNSLIFLFNSSALTHANSLSTNKKSPFYNLFLLKYSSAIGQK